MHRLILMRHAKTERRAESGLDRDRDRDRALTPGGSSDAALMGRILADKGLRPDLAIVSSATRTRQTWDAMEDHLGDVEVRIEPRLYDAQPEVIRRFVEDAEDQAGCLLILCHNPGVQLLAMEYLTESAASPSVLDRMAGGFPTGAAAIFEVDVAGRYTYDGFLTPKAFGGGTEE